MSTLRNLASQTAIYGACIFLLFCSCSIDPEQKIIGTWVIMPSSEDSLFIDEDHIIWVSEDRNIADTSSYQIKGDSIWIERSKHMRSSGVDSFQIMFDGPSKFDLLRGIVKEHNAWYERAEP